MAVGEMCNREVVIVEAQAPVEQAAKLMRDHHVGDLVVVERRAGQPVPVGMLTDRDIVVEVLAEKVDPQSVVARDIMSTSLFTAREEDELVDVVARMRGHGVRRMPIVNAQGGLEGIIAADDILELLAEQMNGLAGLMVVEQRRERERSVAS